MQSLISHLKYLRKFAEGRRTGCKKTESFNSTSAILFTNSNEKYNELINGLYNKLKKTENKISGVSSSYADMLQQLSFFKIAQLCIKTST